MSAKVSADDEQTESVGLSKDKEWTHIHFSGDIGPVSKTHIPNILFRDHHIPYYTSKHKYIVLESTYGGQNRDKTEYTFDKKIKKLQEIIEPAFMKGSIIIPAFALDRAQQILVDLYFWKKHTSVECKRICADFDTNLKLKHLLAGNNKKEEIKNKIISIRKEKGLKEEEIEKKLLFKDLPSDIQDDLLTGWDMKWDIDIKIDSPLKYKNKRCVFYHAVSFRICRRSTP